MSDEIKQPGNTPRITPVNQARDAGRRKAPQKHPAKPAAGNRRKPPSDDKPHRVDEYV